MQWNVLWIRTSFLFIFICIFDRYYPAYSNHAVSYRTQEFKESIQLFMSTLIFNFSTTWCFYFSYLLIYLNNILGNNTVMQKCHDEMLAHRKMLMQDYRLSPEIVNSCRDDILKFCKKGVDFGEDTIHCLMKHSKARRRTFRVSDVCQREVSSKS